MTSGDFTDPTMTHGLEMFGRGWWPYAAYGSEQDAMNAAERMVRLGYIARVLDLETGRIVG